MKLFERDAWRSYIRLWGYCLPYKKRLLAAIASMILSALFGIVPPWLMKNVVDDVLIKGQSMMLNLLAVGVVVLFFGKALFAYAHVYLMTWVGQRVIMDLRMELYKKTQHLPFASLYSRRSGEFLSRITNDVSTLQQILGSVVVDFVVQGVTFLGILGILIVLNWKLMIYTFLVIPIAVLVIDRASAKLRKVGGVIQEQLAQVSAVAQEALSSIRIVRAFATEDLEYARFREQCYSHFSALMKGTQARGVLEGVVEVVLVMALALILWLGGRDVVDGKLTAGALIAFLTYLGLLVQPVRVLSRVVSSIQQGVASADRIFEILDEENEVPLSENPKRPDVRGELSFESVVFGYEKARPVLKNLSVTVRAGEKVAIVGGTGAGKSTFADLILRFYDPEEGRIALDGTDLRDLDLKWYRQKIGVVPQDPVLMKGSFAYNITYGAENLSLEAVEKAAQTAGIHAFISSLPEGYNTEIGERGITLSGGQRQRVAIARAIVREPAILLMDEATSSLDVAVEKQIQEAMTLATRGRTSVVIAHRLSTIRDADRILVLEQGQIVEEGTHAELLHKNGRYATLYRLQGQDTDGPSA